MSGVSFVVPVHNGSAWVRDTLQSIFAQSDGRPMEVIVVDDHSRDGSSALLQHLSGEWPLRILRSGGRGAAAAINTGVRAARYSIICQIDQDVVLQAGWLQHVVAKFDDPRVGAVQGYYETDPSATVYARLMGWDLEQRYAAITGDLDHVCTGNAAYLTEALRSVGLFDTSLGYGYDNDISYRLREAGYRLAFAREARSLHRWRDNFAGYVLQQYGFGYGRLDLVAKHPRRVTGDAVSPGSMMAHPLLTLLALAGFLYAGVMAVLGEPAPLTILFATALLVGLALDRLAAGIRAARQFRHPAPLLFPALHLVRNLAWVSAIVVWSVRRVSRRPGAPTHSMRPGARTVRDRQPWAPPVPHTPHVPARTLCIIPAHNEAESLADVLHEMRVDCPGVDVLVVDDGSTDDTAAIAEGSGVIVIRLLEHLGVGSAIRAGLRYAERAHYDAVVRIDGDGQHQPADISSLLSFILGGRADVVFGSRYTGTQVGQQGLVRLLQRVLAASLSMLTRRLVTDPTSGFCAFGPRAIRLLARHHPSGYPEPELVLLLSRCGLTAIETPVGDRRRLGGRTSLTPARVTAAMARVLLAMVIVPLRGPIEEAAVD